MGRLKNREVVLIDSNADLIGCYESVRDHPGPINDALSALAAGHARLGSAHYYHVRDHRFNPLRDARRSPDGRIAYTPELAAMLIYLNRTGFNGLFRVNARGSFNVPVGRYLKPAIVDPVRLHQVSAALCGPRVRLVWGSFDTVDTIATRGDFLYIDPPYAPLSRTSSFTAYTQPRFDLPDQRRLQALVVALARRGCQLLLSNSTAPEIGALYDTNHEARTSGLRAVRVPARRAVNSNATRRGPVEEFLITNIKAESS
jgi:DNA adenine methylase